LHVLVVDGVEMLDVREAARLVRRTPATVRRWIWSGRLPARRHGNKLLVTRADLDGLPGTRRGPDQMTLAEWANRQASARRSGVLGRSRAGASAADLVLADREGREAG
jgi:excisionase family DNA binding protein